MDVDPIWQLLLGQPIGTRVVVRHKIPGGFTDALGDLAKIDDVEAVVQTRKGPVTVARGAVVAAKPVHAAPSHRRQPNRPL